MYICEFQIISTLVIIALYFIYSYLYTHLHVIKYHSLKDQGLAFAYSQLSLSDFSTTGAWNLLLATSAERGRGKTMLFSRRFLRWGAWRLALRQFKKLRGFSSQLYLEVPRDVTLRTSIKTYQNQHGLVGRAALFTCQLALKKPPKRWRRRGKRLDISYAFARLWLWC